MKANERFSDASWIWYTPMAEPDTYGNFTDRFYYTDGKATCHISCDGDYTLFVNGAFAGSNQYGDFEHYKIYDSIDITDYLTPGYNSVFVTVWHIGIPSSRYKPAKAGLWYQIECGGKTIAKSGKDTLCREDPNFRNGYQKIITSQMGQSFLYDATKPRDTAFHNSVTVDKSCHMYGRPIEKLRLLDRKTVTVLKEEGNHYLIDLGEECVGLPTLDFHTEVMQKITVCWGEHIADGKVRQKIGDRDFSFEYIAQEGHNQFTNYMLRLGCRYLEVFCEASIIVEYIGLIPQVYPAEPVAKTFSDPVKQKIYDLCVNTLKLCLMEHYVDTPWREQSFYAYDSRNQMLCGYRAFRNQNRDYARAGLLLIGQDDRKDDLLSITYPCGTDLAIPSFSLHYITAVKEYLDHTNDLSLGYEVYDKLIKLIRVFEKQRRNGLLYTFEGSEYWNFYDWSAYLSGSIGIGESEPDLMINCLFLMALEHVRSISEKLGKPFACQTSVEELKVGIRKHFFHSQSGLFSQSKDRAEFTELGNAVAVLSGVATKEESLAIAEKLCHNTLESCSLSMKCFKYDAMLKVAPNYRSHIVNEICDTYRRMLDSGATSVWEVIEGEVAFQNAGSLCHGWSAIPILYL